ncbi:MAG: hypothetical protein QNJ70_07605 [Xenococcaceae cyanobacterium MO_207.B15]|nr:hypothetical protein [Xenococcaceae cyanobacterium MO_207.B15]
MNRKVIALTLIPQFTEGLTVRKDKYGRLSTVGKSAKSQKTEAKVAT